MRPSPPPLPRAATPIPKAAVPPPSRVSVPVAAPRPVIPTPAPRPAAAPVAAPRIVLPTARPAPAAATTQALRPVQPSPLRPGPAPAPRSAPVQVSPVRTAATARPVPAPAPSPTIHVGGTDVDLPKDRKPAEAYSSVFDGAEVLDVRELSTLPVMVREPVRTDDERIRNLLISGATESDVACTLSVTLSRVLEVKRTLGADGVRTVTRVTQTQTHVQRSASEPESMPNAKQVFAARIQDLEEVFDRAKQEYLDNPDSESNHVAMTGFGRLIKDLYKAHQDMDDPKDVAEKIIKHILAPFIKNATQHYIETSKKIIGDLEATLSNDYQRATLNDELMASLRAYKEKLRDEYNRAVKTLEVVCDVKLAHMMMKPNPGGDVGFDLVKQ